MRLKNAKWLIGCLLALAIAAAIPVTATSGEGPEALPSLSEAFAPAPAPAMLTQPTVTITSYTKSRYYLHEFSFATAIASLDSAFIYKDSDSNWFSTEGIAYEDSVITLELYSSEATADSVRLTILVYVNSKNTSPTFASAVLAVTDATSFSNTVTGHVNLSIPRQIGLSSRFMIVLLENDANKDATQTITGRLLIPRG